MPDDLYVGLMSGTSLDGVDAVVADLSRPRPRIVSSAHVAFDATLREALLALTASGYDEIETAGRLGKSLAGIYAAAVARALGIGGTPASSIRAIGCHGQTIRHRPEQGFTLQIGNPALLAELSGIAVVTDFRSRDIAAGGQGAPLVPAFHSAVFFDSEENRAVLNVGGIANVTLLPRGGDISGFDVGPGNCLMDLWAQRHLQVPMDIDGMWAAGSTALSSLLDNFMREPYFSRSAPKSCGRELFSGGWIDRALHGSESPQAVQATLLQLTIETVAQAVEAQATRFDRLIVCGGGARNQALMAGLRRRLEPLAVETTVAFGMAVDLVEALAFAWLAQRTLRGETGNIPGVTGARGGRILGAIYPA